MRKTLCALALVGIIGLSPGVANAAHRHHRHHHPASQNAPAPLDLSPIDVQPYVVPTPTDPTQASFEKKMNLENGLVVHASRWIERPEVKSRDLFILQITQSLEGGFDSVNMYDKGVASWGIMQWAAHEGSLGQALIYVKRRLLVTHQEKLWQQLFVANGLDVDGDGLLLYGKPVTDAASARLAFRGTAKVGSFDPKLAGHWAMVLARAGRQPAIQELEVEYASHIVDAVLEKRLPGLDFHGPGRDGLTSADLADNDPYSEALVFALWTNNPRHAFEYVENAARAARSVCACDDPAYWQPGTFSDALLRLCLSSRFGNWQERAAMIQARAFAVHTAPADTLTPFEAGYQQVLAERKERRYVELASRHRVEVRGVTPAMEIARVKRANTALAMIEKRKSEAPLEASAPSNDIAASAMAPQAVVRVPSEVAGVLDAQIAPNGGALPEDILAAIGPP